MGGGFFVRDTILPVSLAWDSFEERNGARSRLELLARIGKYSSNKAYGLDPNIGCTILAEPFFLDRSEWIAGPGRLAEECAGGEDVRHGDGNGTRALGWGSRGDDAAHSSDGGNGAADAARG